MSQFVIIWYVKNTELRMLCIAKEEIEAKERYMMEWLLQNWGPHYHYFNKILSHIYDMNTIF